jgi:hypothetical protein
MDYNNIELTEVLTLLLGKLVSATYEYLVIP